MPQPQSEEFKKAAADSKKLTSKPSDSELLEVRHTHPPRHHAALPANLYGQLYALYKQGTQDPTFEEGEKPGMFDLKVSPRPSHPATDSPLIVGNPRPKGKAKRAAWAKLVNEEVTPEEAQTRYVALVEKLKEKYGYDAEKDPETVGTGS